MAPGPAVAGRAVLAGYRLAGQLVAPLARPHLTRRIARGKEDPVRWPEKRGVPSAPRPSEPPIWIHAVSVGETVAALPLIRALAASPAPVLVTTATPAAARRLADAAVPMIHQFAPLDAPPFVARFLDHFRPKLALTLEAEIWPTTLHALAARGVPRAHVSARISDKSFAAWSRRLFLAKPLFGLVGCALAQSQVQADRFLALGTPHCAAMGNLKFDAPPPRADPQALATLRAATSGRPIWLAASTHPGEDAIVLAAARALQSQMPDLLTVIAPRHPERGAAIAALARDADLGPVRQRSAGEGPDGAIYLADTLGEMGTLFAFAPVTLLCGSLLPLGGHNPAEPAAHGSAILTGPSTSEMMAPFLAAGVAEMVDASTLAPAVARLLADNALRAERGAAAKAVLAAERGALTRTLAYLAPLLDAAPARP